MDIELRYFDDCPNWEKTADVLQSLIVDLDLDATLTTRRIATPEEAEAVHFLGSPSIVVNGEDPFAEVGAPVGLTCRLYRTETGFAAMPSIAQLTAALATS